jgi:hypothetical protein
LLDINQKTLFISILIVVETNDIIGKWWKGMINFWLSKAEVSATEVMQIEWKGIINIQWTSLTVVMHDIQAALLARGSFEAIGHGQLLSELVECFHLCQVDWAGVSELIKGHLQFILFFYPLLGACNCMILATMGGSLGATKCGNGTIATALEGLTRDKT